MKRSSLIILLVCVMIFKCNAQYTWWSNKYNVTKLEELGLKELQLQLSKYKEQKNIGICMLPVGIGISALGFNHILDNMFTSDDSGFAILLGGVGVFITGTLVTLINLSRQKEIEKAINSLGSNTSFNIDFNVKNINSDVGVQLTLTISF